MIYNHFVSNIFFYEKMGFRLFNFRVTLLERIEKIIKEIWLFDNTWKEWNKYEYQSTK